MAKEVKDIVAEKVRWVFGDVAEQILKIEEERHGMLIGNNMSPEDAERLLKDLKELSLRMAGPSLADRVCEEVSAAILPPKLRRK
jgi:cystathionine beta-lyase/cystathionine gamma-synthase